MDIRDVRAEDLHGFDAVLHLAAISNDPLGNLNPGSPTTSTTWPRCGWPGLAAGRCGAVPVRVVVQPLRGAGGTGFLDEEAPFNPVTPYGESKILVEQDVPRWPTPDFSPVFFRNATAYGVSPQLRVDIMVNNLVGYAVTTGQVPDERRDTVAATGPRRGHLGAFLATLEAPRELAHNQAFNVGITEENFRVREVAEMVEAVTGCEATFAEGASADARGYRVDFAKPAGPARVPAALDGPEGRRGALRGLSALRPHRGRVPRRPLRPAERDRRLQSEGRLDDELRWTGVNDG